MIMNFNYYTELNQKKKKVGRKLIYSKTRLEISDKFKNNLDYIIIKINKIKITKIKIVKKKDLIQQIVQKKLKILTKMIKKILMIIT